MMVEIEARPATVRSDESAARKRIGMPFVVKNTGESPCRLLGGYVGYHVAPAPSPYGPDLMRGDSRSLELSAQVLAPGQAVPFGSETIPSEDASRIDGVLEGRERLWLVGRVDYEDASGELFSTGYARCFSQDSHTFEESPDAAFWNHRGPMRADVAGHYGRKV